MQNTSSTDINEACKVLRQGQIVAYPTESVFGIGCDAFNHDALRQLRKIKHREVKKGFIVLCASLEQLLLSFPSLAISPTQQKQLQALHAHPTTWLISNEKSFSPLLHGDNVDIAIRITQHPIAKILCESVGPIVSTSANKAGETPATDLATIETNFGTSIHYYLDGELGGANTPSQIIRLNNGEMIRRA